jgi:hypothetical protein
MSASANVLAQESLRALLDDNKIPDALRLELSDEFTEIEAMLRKLEQGALHVAVFGRVSVGKSALLNSLLGEPVFQVGVLHGTTTERESAHLKSINGAPVFLIDTPGIDEVSGEAREALAKRVALRADLVLFVLDADLTASEHQALSFLFDHARALLVVLNKKDRYRTAEIETLLARLRDHVKARLRPEHVLAVSADPAPRTVIRIDAAGRESEQLVQPKPDVDALSQLLEQLLSREGQQLAALNAGELASLLSDELGERVIAMRKQLSVRLIKTYALSKGVGVGLNPIPVADLLTAAGIDVALVLHLARLFGLPMSKFEAGELVAKIALQLAALMGAIWGVHLVASALKTLSLGLSTAVTAGAQGALAYYATLITGKAAEAYLANGKSWGDKGPKRMVKAVLAQIDRDSVLADAKSQIAARLKL